MTPAKKRNREHMERVRAVHRRSAYERVLDRIRFIEHAQDEEEAGLRPPLRPHLVEELAHLRTLRAAIHAEMVAAGQVPGCACPNY